MKVGIVSDLHAEFWRDQDYQRIGKQVQATLADADVILLAGDIALGTAGIALAQTLFPDKPVYLVAGNHEFYHHDYDTLLVELREAAQQTANVHFLHKDVAMLKIENRWLRIVGTALWTDFDLHGNVPLGMHAAIALNDYGYIRYRGGKLRAHDTLAWHQDERRWLLGVLDESFDASTVLLTHHAPVSFAISPRYVGDQLSPCFASRMENLLLRDDLPLVVWGHTHYCVDRIIENTRFVSNQTGYPAATGVTETGQFGQIVEL